MARNRPDLPCNGCGQEPRSEGGYLGDSCREIRSKVSKRNRDLRSKFGIDESGYQKMLAEQDGGCAVCAKPETEAAKGRLHVDHDHSTGKVRALLCSGCNIAIGQVGEDPNRLIDLATYLMSFRNVLEVARG